MVTNNPESDGAKVAEYILNVNTPAFPQPGPGLRNYYASLCGLMAFAAYMGEAKGMSEGGSLESLFNAIRKYTADMADALERIDDQMFSTAVKWKDITAVETIGDYTDRASAAFIAAKYVEVDGMMATTVDTENWCHVNYFAHEPEKIGTVVVSTKHFSNFSRVKETIMTVNCIGRASLLITTGTAQDYDIENQEDVCMIPEAPEGYDFIEPILNYIPGAILASYSAAIHDEPYFRGNESPQAVSKCGTTIKSSQIRLI